MNWEIVLYSSATVGVIFALIAIAYYISTAKRIKKQHTRYEELLNSLKPGMDVVFAGGLVGTIQSIDAERTFATIKVGSSTLQTTVYSISNILEK